MVTNLAAGDQLVKSYKCSIWIWVRLVTSVAAGDGSDRSQISSVAAGDQSGWSQV